MPKTRVRRLSRPRTAKRSTGRSGRVASRAAVAAWHRALVSRLNDAAAGCTLEQIGRMTGANHETVRRYMQHGRVPAQFIHEFCLAFKVTPEWLLTGKGTRKGR